jgi:hypothetical protein
MVMKSQSTGDPIGATVPLLLVGGGGIAASMLLPALAKAKAKANALKSMNNAGQLTKTMIFTALDNDGNLPDSDKWCDSIFKEVGTLKVYASPQDPFAMSQVDEGIKVSSYAFNKALSGKKEAEVNPNTVMIFETDLGWNGSGGLEDALEFLEFFDGHAIAVSTVDGTVRQVSNPFELRQMRWDP